MMRNGEGVTVMRMTTHLASLAMRSMIMIMITTTGMSMVLEQEAIRMAEVEAMVIPMGR